ncbi:MAG: T9SS type A sorting domain-containing protein [Bacteroidetes bacterium]|nr:T9SS type A sorting domain-containing protein [Bacteroidota bacterium]
MKKIILSFILILAISTLFATEKGYQVKFSQPNNSTYVLSFELGEHQLSEVNLNGIVFSEIIFNGSVKTNQKGFAALPFIHASVQLSQKRNVSLSVLESEYIDYYLDYPLVPSRGVIYRDQDPSAIPYEIEKKSIVDKWYPEVLAKQTDPYIIRDIRGTSVYVYPFRYNAAKNILRVYKSVRVQLVENNDTPINSLDKESGTVLYEMDAVYRSVFINYDQNRDDLTIGEIGDILVICTDRDEDAIEPYIQWKKEKGYNISMEVVATGTNVDNLIQQKYDENNNLLYVQLVGDWPDIKSNILGYDSPMDPQLGCVVGTDEFADICVGRFSANDPSHVTIQVNKVINYEKDPEMGASWYETATGIASNQGPGDDNELDYEHNDVIFNDKLDPFTYETYNSIYDPSANQSMVSTAVNTGTSVINYTGHGSPTSWGSSGFSNSNVAALTNGDRLPFIVSVACSNGNFHQTSGDCFAEAWLKKENGGAVIFLGATIGQPWDPPMRGQDYFMDVLIGGYDYSAHPGQNGINTDEQRTTLGSFVFNGLTLMCTEAGDPQDWETAKTWTTFGDPSMQVRTAPPADLTVSNNTIIAGIPFQTTITSSSGPVEGAMVAISQSDDMFRGFTDTVGIVSINHTFTPGTALLVVTGFNTVTVYDTVNVIPASGAYVVYAYHTINDATGNGDGLIDYGENINLSLALTNIGSEDATNVDVILSTDDDYISFTDSLEFYGTITAGDTVIIPDAFMFDVANDIPDNHNILFNITSTGDEVWNSSFFDEAHAPELVLEGYIINDPGGNNNGKLDPGETAELIITIENSGSSEAFDVYGELLALSEYITVDENTLYYGNIAGAGSEQQTYTVTADENTPAAHSADFEYNMSANLGISSGDSFYIVVGQIPVLVIDLDGNNNSADEMITCLNDLGIEADYTNSFTGNLELYASIFVCLGVDPNNHVLNSTEGQTLADFLNNGGMLYMEGADTWYYDGQTAVHDMFNIDGVEDGTSDLSGVIGQSGTITDGMEYNYSGDNNYMDHIAPVAPAEMIFMNTVPSYGCGVSYDAGSYKTIGMSFEFGGLDDDEFTKEDLMIVILDFFGIEGFWTNIDDIEDVAGLTVNGIYPNPFISTTTLSITLPCPTHVIVEVYNINGQKMNSLVNNDLGRGTHKVEWDATNDAGVRLSEGIYFYRIITNAGSETRKVVIMQ